MKRAWFRFAGRWLPCLRVVLLCIRYSGGRWLGRVDLHSTAEAGGACWEQALVWEVVVGVVVRLAVSVCIGR